ncbi:hypothetical protein D3C78_1445060 [compost metagenome]
MRTPRPLTAPSTSSMIRSFLWVFFCVTPRALSSMSSFLITSTSAGRWPVRYAKSMATLNSSTALAYTAFQTESFA